MKKIIYYIFSLLILISLVHITKDIIEFSREIIISKDYQLKASIKEKLMMRPTVKITSVVLASTGPDAVPVHVKLSSATGFSVKYNVSEDETMIMTNDHFCQAAPINEVKFLIETYKDFGNSNSSMIIEGRHILSRPSLDLCIISIPGYIRPVEFVEYDYDLAPFQKVYIIGAPSGTYPIVIDTYVSRYMDRAELKMGTLDRSGNPFVLISEQVFPGHSGSPVFTEDGKVAAVIFGALRTYGGLAISAKDVYRVLETLEE